MNDGGLLTSRTLNRALPWIAGAVLLLGVLAFWQTQVRSESTPETFSNDPATNVGAAIWDPLSAASNHSPEFFLDETALRTGTRALLQLAVDYLRGQP